MEIVLLSYDIPPPNPPNPPTDGVPNAPDVAGAVAAAVAAAGAPKENEATGAASAGKEIVRRIRYNVHE